jgi:hypothetical protein
MQGAPPFNLAFLERFMSSADAVIQSLANAEAERSAAARGNTLGVQNVQAMQQGQPEQVPTAAPPAAPPQPAPQVA